MNGWDGRTLYCKSIMKDGSFIANLNSYFKFKILSNFMKNFWKLILKLFKTKHTNGCFTKKNVHYGFNPWYLLTFSEGYSKFFFIHFDSLELWIWLIHQSYGISMRYKKSYKIAVNAQRRNFKTTFYWYNIKL